MGRLVDLNDDSYESIMWRRQSAKFERQKQAQMEHEIFFKNLTISIDNFKARLAKEKEPGFDDCPDWLQPYRPKLWSEMSFPPNDWKSNEVLAKIIAYKALAPEAIRNHITHKVSFGAWYIPKVNYEVVAPPPSPRSKGHSSVKGVPCLRWLMDTYILSTIEFWSKEGTIPDKQDEWTWDIECTPECLGKSYNGPVFWKCQDAFVTPVSLLAKLAWGKAELPGVEVLKRDSPWTTYGIEGLPDEVTLHDDFNRFIRDMMKNTTLYKALLNRGMCDTETAILVKAKLEKLQKQEATAAVLEIASEPESKTGDDYTDMVDALTHQMGYKDAEATKAAKHVCQKSPGETLENKIKLALQFLSQ